MNKLSLVLLILIVRSLHSQDFYVPNTQEEVIAFWDIQRVLYLDKTALDESKKNLPRVFSSYIDMLFETVENSTALIEILKFMKLSDAHGEQFVKGFIKLVKTETVLFQETYDLLPSDLEEYIVGIINDYMSVEERYRMRNEYPGIDAFK
ncbi:hypothetical protein QA601_18755 [Chitinispirillales bacterium ANBcel5]|uniref:hypothetical protein n=1 Tax=Cellulosispirillum alkaliphilum TaxID=3039283 RepID=UPI002A535F54|nr:hypothetical protein [Chitinispirillales bacterium ANBcel5]